MRCPRCGNENQDGNRFCGQCGATLLAVAATPAAQSERTAPTSQRAVPERPPAAQRNEERPSISGPSFLGLADAPPPRRSRGSLSIDPHPSHSGNLDYLLEDEEEPRGGGAGKVFLILIALALAAGFGYVRFKTHGFPWASAGTNKPAATTQPTDSDTATNAPAPVPSTPSITEEPHPQPTPSQPPASTPVPAANSAAPHDNSAANSPPSSTEKSAAPAPDADTSPSKPANGSANSTPPDSSTADSGAADSGAADSDKDTAAPATAEPAPKPKAAERPAKPHAASKPVEQVAEAQRYLYGKGVPQDCDHGLRILKPLANQADPKAMIELGALYSAGLCTPRDLPTAYRWFAMVLRKDPSNDTVQADLQKLWGEMTQPERQLAIKLTQ